MIHVVAWMGVGVRAGTPPPWFVGLVVGPEVVDVTDVLGEVHHVVGMKFMYQPGLAELPMDVVNQPRRARDGVVGPQFGGV